MHCVDLRVTVKTRLFKKPIFENEPVLGLIQWCYFQKHPEIFLNLIGKKLLNVRYFYFLFSAVM